MAEASDNVSSKVDKLQEENQSLKMRIKLMEEGQMRDLTLLSNQKVEEGISPKEVEELQSKVKSWEKKNERLMEAFKKTSKDFRKLTTELTGYRINSDPGEQFYRVSSVYSDSPEIEALLFKRDDKGELLLLQNDYAEALGHLIKVHLDTQDSIPAFLAGLTLDLMAKTQSFEADEDEPICID
ncbi:Mitotic spindle assembly checkpoint protein MAD1like [Caligus rogercresseyi]|uniref:Mitotic spindle assembly checkpoint protein MAD1like n=1 Tax=Caligus rogercresseyi TaxID=217165 RepID=A0A7T8QVY9_CALRO|nr:Mitotic spindle assembly checkpoint protein MAD1like [Caligus rogercresseyi]